MTITRVLPRLHFGLLARGRWPLVLVGLLRCSKLRIMVETSAGPEPLHLPYGQRLRTAVKHWTAVEHFLPSILWSLWLAVIPMQRLTCFLSGRVQGVGMRYAVHDLARNYPVTGFVENTQDGRVRIVIEGPIEQLDAMLERLLEIAPGHIRMLDRYQSQATGEFQQFVIQRFES